MNIEINPETEQRLQKEIQRGHFNNLDELLSRALDALEKEEISGSPQAGNPSRLVEALMSPPFAHSELYIPPRRKDSHRLVDL
ncbi:MAG TPA: hypothetical protein VKG25_10325 [Bryobacteraceae bacterium]|nr:hypothetical protein [Bryobacteraceae bacterium]